jgi:hypothetical protein
VRREGIDAKVFMTARASDETGAWQECTVDRGAMSLHKTVVWPVFIF